MNRYIKILNAQFPEFEMDNIHNNVRIRNKTMDEAKEILSEYEVPLPDELTKSKYLEQTYAGRSCYLINNRHYLLKLSKTGYPYLHEV